MAEQKKGSAYISAGESRRITKFNRRVTRKLEKARADAGKDPALYTTVMKDSNNVVEFDNVCTYFFSDVGTVKAVDGVNFSIPKHSTVGVVGESGCGKSVTSLSLMQLLQRPSGQVVGGEIRFNKGDGTAYNIANTPNSVMEHIRGNKISMIFQEPMTSLNPVFKIGAQVDEVTKLHFPDMDDEAVKARTLEMLDLVGIANKEGVYNMYPHELSGGMRQRICIARALALNPEFVVCDEPVSALDVSIQAQIINLLKNLQEQRQLSYLFISHDLSVVEHISDSVGVMYLGNLVEYGDKKDIFSNPLHPYTKALFSAIPIPDPKARMNRIVLEGSIPSPANPPTGCKFHTRCKYCTERCKSETPVQKEIETGHYVVCHNYE